MSVPAEAIVTIVDELRALLPDRVSTAAAVREQHGHDESYHRTAPPDVVVFPESTEEVAQVVGLCAKHRCPHDPVRDRDVARRARPGAARGGLDRRHPDGPDPGGERRGPRLPHRAGGQAQAASTSTCATPACSSPSIPGADASLGGMAATRASGTNAVRYGTMRENVLGLTVVLADGRIVKTGGRARKSAAGYDLTRLFVGSEGTLGVITEIRLRLHGIPEAVSAAVCPFGSLAGAVDTVIQTIQCGVPVARIELLDEVQMDAVNRYSGLDYPVSPTLFFEFHGSGQGVREQVETVGAPGGREHRRGVPVGDPPGGSIPAVAGATRCVLRGDCATSRRAGLADGRLRPDLEPGGVHPGDARGHRCVRVARPHRRPRRGRELPPVVHPRPRRRRGAGAGGGGQRAHGGPRPRHGRHLHRRARHRLRQDRVPQPRARERGGLRDAADQAGPRSREPHESRQDSSVDAMEADPGGSPFGATVAAGPARDTFGCPGLMGQGGVPRREWCRAPGDPFPEGTEDGGFQ